MVGRLAENNYHNVDDDNCNICGRGGICGYNGDGDLNSDPLPPPPPPPPNR